MPTTRAKPKDTRKGDRHTSPGYIIRMPADLRERFDRARAETGRPGAELILLPLDRYLTKIGFGPKK